MTLCTSQEEARMRRTTMIFSSIETINSVTRSRALTYTYINSVKAVIQCMQLHYLLCNYSNIMAAEPTNQYFRNISAITIVFSTTRNYRRKYMAKNLRSRVFIVTRMHQLVFSYIMPSCIWFDPQA
jgi:hypothetical protein